MTNTGSKGRMARKPWLKIIVLGLGVVCLVLILNAYFGNPIRKQRAKSTCVDYFQSKYHEEFIIHEVTHARKLSGYVLVLSPKSDPQFQFACNPNCDPICISDEYGGKLASRLLIEQVNAILEPGYRDLALQISASEDPYTWYGRENPDFFESDPTTRITRNHQDLRIAWVDPAIQPDEFSQIAETFAGLITTQLPFINPDLQVHVSVYPDLTSQAALFEAHFPLFPTTPLEE